MRQQQSFSSRRHRPLLGLVRLAREGGNTRWTALTPGDPSGKAAAVIRRLESCCDPIRFLIDRDPTARLGAAA